MKQRRHFLKSLGLGLSMVPLQGITGETMLSTTKNINLKIGVLMPSQQGLFSYSNDFLLGLQLGLDPNVSDHTKTTFNLYVENTTNSPYKTEQKAKKLLKHYQPDLFIALASSCSFPTLTNLLNETKTPALLNTMEGNAFYPTKKSPYVYYNSLNHWQSSYLLGKQTVKKVGQKISILSSTYDSGYDTLYAFKKGVIEAGGQIEETILTDRTKNAIGDIAIALEKMAVQSLDGIYVSYSGQDIFAFAQAYQQSNLFQKIPIVTHDFMIQQLVTLGYHDICRGMHSVSAWTKNVANTTNQTFIHSFQEKYKQTPNSVAMLGYESGQCLQQSMVKANGQKGKKWAEAMRQLSFESPRGTFNLDQQTHQNNTSFYSYQVRKNVDRTMAQAITKKTSSIPPLFAATDVRTGINALYLC